MLIKITISLVLYNRNLWFFMPSNGFDRAHSMYVELTFHCFILWNVERCMSALHVTSKWKWKHIHCSCGYVSSFALSLSLSHTHTNIHKSAFYHLFVTRAPKLRCYFVESIGTAWLFIFFHSSSILARIQVVKH